MTGLFTKSYDNDWANTVMIFASKNPDWTHEQAVEAAKTEYSREGLVSPWDDGWKGSGHK